MYAVHGQLTPRDTTRQTVGQTDIGAEWRTGCGIARRTNVP